MTFALTTNHRHEEDARRAGAPASACDYPGDLSIRATHAQNRFAALAELIEPAAARFDSDDFAGDALGGAVVMEAIEAALASLERNVPDFVTAAAIPDVTCLPGVGGAFTVVRRMA